MIRPMAYNVSALSGVVANGHQAIHFVSSAPSKIPYGGFSPVRLQTRWMVHRHLPSPDFHRLDWQPYGLRAKERKERREISLICAMLAFFSGYHLYFIPRTHQYIRDLQEKGRL